MTLSAKKVPMKYVDDFYPAKFRRYLVLSNLSCTGPTMYTPEDVTNPNTIKLGKIYYNADFKLSKNVDSNDSKVTLKIVKMNGLIARKISLRE